MKNIFELMWRFKWIPLFTLMAESLLILPVYLLLSSFGESSFAYNSSLTPFGSSEFVGLFIDAVKNDHGLKYAVVAFAFLLPATFLLKLMLASGTMSMLQQNQMNGSKWLAQGAQHLMRALALFLRWIFIPVIWSGLCIMLLKFEIEWMNKAVFVLIAIGWFYALSWFYFALIVVVRNEKKSLRKAFKCLLRNKLYILLTIVVFALTLASVNVMSLLAVQYDLNNTFISTMMLAFSSALLLRVVVFFWQSSHMVMWLRH